MILGMDTAQAVSAYLSLLFAPTDLVEIRLLPSGRKLFAVARDWVARLSDLEFANREGKQNVYCGANPRLREGGREEDVACARCLFVDWDDIEPDTIDAILADRKLPMPTLAVHSGHGVHAYWRLIEPASDLAAWRRAQERLIARAGSDPRIKDPPRIMRLPGLLNLPDDRKGETEAVPVSIIAISAESVYRIEEVAGADAAPPAPAAAALPSNPMDRYARLSRATMQYILAGAPRGNRQTGCFHAACDMAGNGFSREEAEEKLLPAAVACGLPEAEAWQAIQSAFGRPRNPSMPAEDGPVGSAFQHGGIPSPAKNGEAKAVAPSPVERQQISNVIDSSYRDNDGNDVQCRYHIALPAIRKAVFETMGDWPRSAGGVLFAVKNQTDEIPSNECVHYLTDGKKLFAWLGEKCNLRWSMAECIHHQSKHKLNPPTKDEMFANLVAFPAHSYRAIELLPHHPPVPDVFYVPCRLPPAPMPTEEKATPLGELVNRFNPETPPDRQLMLSMILTLAWGGPPGARPAFVLASDHGQGSGKTETAKAITRIFGGAITVKKNEDWERVCGRLLGDESMSKRAILLDNIKGKLAGSDIEGAITAEVIDGHKMYYGQASRLNLFTWIITANAPSLSRDLTGRAVVIQIGPRQHDFDFISWAARHIEQHRAAILSEVLEILAGEPLCRIEAQSRDRWVAWQDAILSRFEDGNELAALIRSRRHGVDADAETARDVAGVLLRIVAARFPDHEQRKVAIHRAVAQEWLTRAKLVDPKMSLGGCTSMVRALLFSEGLRQFRYHEMNDGAWWLYAGSRSPKCRSRIDRIDNAGEVEIGGNYEA